MKALKFLFHALLVILAAASLVVIAFNLGAMDTFAGLETCTSMEQITDKTEQDLKSGRDTSMFFSKGVNPDEIRNINAHMSCFFGDVKRYGIRKHPVSGLYRVTLWLNPSVNVYAYEKLVDDTDMAAPDRKSQKLCDKSREILKEIIKKKMSDYGKEKAVHDYIVKNCTFCQSARSETDGSGDIYTAYGCLVNGKGVCSAYSQAMYLLCRAAGLKAEIVTGRAQGEPHSWNQVKLGGDWYNVDVTWDDPVMTDSDMDYGIQYGYFNVPDSALKKQGDHSYSGTGHRCRKSDENYYYQEKLVCSNLQDLEKKTGSAVKGSKKTVSFLVPDYDSSWDVSFAADDYSEVRSIRMAVNDSPLGKILTFNIKYN